jgi:uncharacterized DUF497 family protein
VAEHDSRKWRRIAQRRRISAEDALVLFDGRSYVEVVDRESSPEEVRHKRTGFDAKGRLITFVYTWRAGARRAITVWRATSDEERSYHEQYGPRSPPR